MGAPQLLATLTANTFTYFNNELITGSGFELKIYRHLHLMNGDNGYVNFITIKFNSKLMVYNFCNNSFSIKCFLVIVVPFSRKFVRAAVASINRC